MGPGRQEEGLAVMYALCLAHREHFSNDRIVTILQIRELGNK